MFNELTVAENVALALCYHHNWSAEQARDEVRAALELTELTGMAREDGPNGWARTGSNASAWPAPWPSNPGRPVSGRTRRRTWKARHRQWWRDFLAQLPERKITVVMSTNDFAPFWHGGDHRYAVIKDHRLQVLGGQAEYPRIE